MLTKIDEYRKRAIDIIAKEGNGVVSYSTDIGLRVEETLLAVMLYNKPYITSYNLSTNNTTFGELLCHETRYRFKLDDDVKPEKSQSLEVEPTLDNFANCVVSISEDFFLIPTDIGLVRFFINYERAQYVPSIGTFGIKIYTWSEENAKKIADFVSSGLIKAKPEEKKKDTYQIAISSNYGLSLKTMKFRPIECNIKDNYNDNLPYDRICQLLNSDKQELIMFYGEPGTGKTTLIKHLMNEFIDKQIIVMDTNNISTIGDDRFLKFLSDNSNSIMVLEDCDKILKTRESGNNIMSTVLNLTDGLIGESFNIKFICTFNTSEKKLDPALLRKGRLSLMYRFCKLNVNKVRKFIPDATEDMPIGDIFNREENIIGNNSDGKIGF